MAPEKVWYREPQWISAVLAAAALLVGTIWSQASGEAQTRDNTTDIAQIKADIKNVPADISSIRQAQDDQRELLRHMSNRLDKIGSEK